MDSKIHNAGLVFIVVVSIFLGWLFPYEFNRLDPMWVITPFLLYIWAQVAYFTAMIYNKSYGVIWPGGHSTTAHGGIEITFPARDYYPEMAAIPLGGGNYQGILFRGGKRKGWLMAPRSLIQVVDKQIASFAAPVEQREPDQLPPHIRNQLEQHNLYDPDGMIAWALTRKDDTEFDPTAGMSASELLKQNALLCETVTKLNEDYKAQLDHTASVRREFREMGVRIGESDKETFTDKFKESIGGE